MNPRSGFIVGALLTIGALLCLIAGVVSARGDQETPRQRFFREATSARLVGGAVVNCCGEGDATYVRVMGENHDGIAVEVIDVGQHPTAKVGLHVVVPHALQTRGLANPLGRAVLFLSTSDLRPICFIEEPKG